MGDLRRPDMQLATELSFQLLTRTQVYSHSGEVFMFSSDVVDLFQLLNLATSKTLLPLNLIQ